MDEMEYHKHYITVGDRGCVTDGWSDGPHPERDTAGAVLLTEKGSYQFRLCPGGAENPPLMGAGGIPLYAWDGTRAVPRGAEEIAADRAAVKETPTQLDQIEAQATYTAMMTDTLLEV